MPKTLYEYYTSKGQVLPSVAARVPLATQAGISNYTGTAAQNTQLLAHLQSSSAPAAAPTPVSTTPATPASTATATQSPAPTATQSPAPTVGDIYAKYGGISPEDTSYNSMGSRFQYTTPDAYTVDQQNADRAAVVARHQAEIDAANRMMNDELTKARVVGQDRVGQGYAVQARRGMLGSNMGDAVTSSINGINDQEQTAIRDKYMAQIAAIMGAANTEATNEINGRLQAAQKGYETYMQYLNGGAARAKARATSAAKTLLAQGIDPTKDATLLTAVAKNYQLSSDVLLAAYMDEKKTADDAAINQKYKEALTQNQLDQNRYKTLADGAQLWDTSTGSMIGNNAKDQKINAAAMSALNLNIPDQYKSYASKLVKRVAANLPSTRQAGFLDAVNSATTMDELVSTLVTAPGVLTADQKNSFALSANSINALDTAIKALQTKVQTGIEKFGQQWLYNKAGFDADPEIAKLQGDITMATQGYRKSVTGVAWGPQEQGEYDTLIGSTKFAPAELMTRLTNFRQLLKGGILKTMEMSLDPMGAFNGGSEYFNSQNNPTQTGGDNAYLKAVQDYKAAHPNATVDEVRAYFQQNPITPTAPTRETPQDNPNVLRLDWNSLNVIPPGQSARLDAARESIAKIESSTSGDYAALGKKLANGDQAIGRYQVMASNIPSWTEQYLGQKLTPQQFLNSPEAQDAVFNGHFADLVRQYGTFADAASAWFSGRPLKGNNSKDINGTSVPQYVLAFNKHFNNSLS